MVRLYLVHQPSMAEITLIRPTNERGERVAPSDLEQHWISHRFRGPCCLCPMVHGEDDITEAALVLVTHGRLSGEYIAKCARNLCGYFGERFRCINWPRV